MKKCISVKSVGWIYFFIHFSVETACFYFLFSRLSSSPIWWGLALLFDAVAFLPQSFLGVLQDKYPGLPSGFVGCVFILIALLIKIDLIALLLLGIGNALLHISGAQKTLSSNNGKIAPCSIFVGGGSFGVVTGQLLGLTGIEVFLLIPLILIFISAILTSFIEKSYIVDNESTISEITSNKSTYFIVSLAFVAVAIRAYIGYAIPTEWNKTETQTIVLFVFMGTGKALGGVLADKMGYIKTTYISLILSLPFLLFGNSIMFISLIGVGLFSMTMPVTIAILVSNFPEMPCYSFGITTVGLFFGTLPAFFIRPNSLLEHQLVVLCLSILALFSILGCLKRNV